MANCDATPERLTASSGAANGLFGVFAEIDNVWLLGSGSVRLSG